jgi:short-subunit dehydrogenase
MPSESRARRIVVTGAGSGIGQAIADRLIAAGHSVVGTVRGTDRARALTEAARAAGVRLEYLPLDLSSALQIREAAARVTERGGVDVLVNNAGFGLYGAVEDATAEEALRQLTVNLLGPIELTRLLLPALRSREGRIIWIGSLAGRQSLAFQGHYSASKAAVAAISDALRMELRPLGVQVACVEPGDIATGFTDARVAAVASSPVYAARAARSRAAVEREERGAPGPACVARAVERLVVCRHLPTRVPVGRLGRTTSVFLRVVPHAVGQFMARRRYQA